MLFHFGIVLVWIFSGCSGACPGHVVSVRASNKGRMRGVDMMMHDSLGTHVGCAWDRSQDAGNREEHGYCVARSAAVVGDKILTCALNWGNLTGNTFLAKSSLSPGAVDVHIVVHIVVTM